MKPKAPRLPSSFLWLAPVLVAVVLVAALPGWAAEETAAERLDAWLSDLERQDDLERSLRYHCPYPPIFYRDRCRDLERERAELVRAPAPPELAATLEHADLALVGRVATVARDLHREDLVSALRRILARLDDEGAREGVERALCVLGEPGSFESEHGEDRDRWIDRFLTDAPDRHEVWWKLLETCSHHELARRSPRTARLLVDVYARSVYHGFGRLDLRLRAGDRVKILDESEGRLRVYADGRIGEVDRHVLLEGDPPPADELREGIRKVPRTGDWLSLLRPVQILVHVHGVDPGEVPLDPVVVRLLASLPRMQIRGDGETYHQREIVALEPATIVVDGPVEIRARVEDGGWEGSGEATEIYHGLGGAGPPRWFRFETRHVAEVEYHRTFLHFVDLDADADLEVVKLEGTLSYPEPEWNARTWKVTLYDHEGRTFVAIPWTEPMRDFLARRLRETDDVLERTILRSHFGPDGPPATGEPPEENGF